MDCHRGSATINCLLPSALDLSLSSHGWTANFSGAVVSALDGDTIEVLHNNRAERIQLNGIDCPEKRKAYSKCANRAASELVFGKQAYLVMREGLLDSA